MVCAYAMHLKQLFLLSALVTVASVYLTGAVRHYALKIQLLDHPNDRSSHILPTPRGGGLSIVAMSLASLLLLLALGQVDFALAIALLGGGIAVAFIGFQDDRGSVSVRLRMTVHSLAAAWGMYWLGGMPSLQIHGYTVDLGFYGDALGTVGIVWALNLFNFMDGVDGIAGSEAVFMGIAGGVLGLVSGDDSGVVAMAFTLSAASAGFLVWNWPPAKVFMGDVGSGYLGYVIAVLAVAAAREHPAAISVWLILGGFFFIDATVTLVRRLIRGKRAYEAHCSHAYQILARRWGSHRSVTLTVLLINLLILWPAAWLAIRHPSWAWSITIVVLTGLSIAVVATGAGEGKDVPSGQL
jgi:Fuc2NAc and GlcNAc transferase